MPEREGAVVGRDDETHAWLYRGAIVVLLVGLFLLGHTAIEGGEDEGARLGVLAPSALKLAPDFTLEDPAGTQISLQDFRGQVVFVNFWATWCIPCRAEMPAMEQLYQELRGHGFMVVAVNFRDAPEAVQAFRREVGVTFPMPLDRQGAVASAYGVRGLPATYLVNRQGQIVGHATGAREWHSADAKAYFQRLLAQ